MSIPQVFEQSLALAPPFQPPLRGALLQRLLVPPGGDRPGLLLRGGAAQVGPGQAGGHLRGGVRGGLHGGIEVRTLVYIFLPAERKSC